MFASAALRAVPSLPQHLRTPLLATDEEVTSVENMLCKHISGSYHIYFSLRTAFVLQTYMKGDAAPAGNQSLLR